MRPQLLLLLAVLFEGGLGVSACLLGWLLGHRPWQSIHWTTHAALVGGAATLPMLLAARWMTRSRLRPLVRLTDMATELVADLFAGASWWQMLLLSLVAGLGEELLFRGLVQDWVGGRYGPPTGLLVASVLFGLAHPMSRTYAVVAACTGLYLGWLWLWSGNLLVPIVTHALYDFLALLYLRRRHKKSGPTRS